MMKMSNSISTINAKILLAFLSTILLTTGCSENDDNLPSAALSAIEFENIFVDNPTRGIITTKNISSFKVYGFVDDPSSVIFDDVLVSKNNGKWVPAKTEYWYPDHRYRFSGIAPAAATSGWQFHPATSPQPGYYGGGTLEFNISSARGNTDLLYAFSSDIATPETMTTPMPPVAMNFRHMLSRVRFTYVNELGNHHYFINVSTTQLRNVCGKATIDLTQENASWQQKDYATAWLDLNGVFVRTESPAMTNDIFLIPCHIDGSEVYIQTQIFYTPDATGTQGHVFSDLATQTVKLPDVDFKPGYTYNFIAHLTADNIMGDGDKLYPIIFTVTETPQWDNTITIDIPPAL